MKEITSSDGLTALLLDDYDSTLDEGKISGERLARRLGEVARIGAEEKAGARRLGFSAEVQEAKNTVMSWMKNTGLDVHQDGAGNVFGRFEGKNPQASTIMTGSHLDTVHWGGHFDGSLGVLSSLEVLEAWNQEGFQPDRPVEIVIFSDEEGVRFTEGMLGSKALTGQLSRKKLLNTQDRHGESLDSILDESGFSIEGMLDSNRNLDEVHAFIELHIEQGPRLNHENAPVGIVTGIAGMERLRLTFNGESGHAGTTPMNQRQDPLVAASNVIQFCAEYPPKINESAVATVGVLDVEPNSINVIPGHVEMGIDVRDTYEETRDELVNRIIDKGHAASELHNVDYQWKTLFKGSPVQLDESIQEKSIRAAEELSVNYASLNSGAGHDAMNLAQKVPTGMLFVRSQGGVSHRPEEWSDLNDCVKGVKVLKRLLEKLSRE